MTSRGEVARIDFRIPIGDETLTGELSVPESAQGVVLFTQGSDASRLSPRNRYIAGMLAKRGLATVLIDLLTPKEQVVDRETVRYRFDIPLLADRVIRVIEWLRERPEAAALPVGLFGTGTGGSAALLVAAERASFVAAVVSRAGRPDLVGPPLTDVTAPTLLLVGGRDIIVARINREALVWMRGVVSLSVIPEATHLFSEPGALEEVASRTADWFVRHLRSAHARAAG
ncbi:MAG TPA: dienelactone hydrolase family protein [Vicinamibacterales bacterium]|nr:dienelactone hydrolase family protein [Vicinamibacterales bacterium]